MKPYSKLSAQEKTLINLKGVLNYNHFTLQSAVQNILQHNQDASLHTDINNSLERCIKDIDNILIKHSKCHENESKNSTDKDV